MIVYSAISYAVLILATQLLGGSVQDIPSYRTEGIEIAHQLASEPEVHMQIQKLETQLLEDAAKDVPPFGAESIKLARQLGSDATSFLLTQIEAQGNIAFLSLEALREADRETYNSLPSQMRAEVYVNTLEKNIFYNAWGLPRYKLTATSNALIALGEEAIPVLKPLLADKRLAPLAGSQDATTSEMYGNRVCDYAWVFISEIKGRSYTYSQNPVERDLEIERLQQEL